MEGRYFVMLFLAATTILGAAQAQSFATIQDAVQGLPELSTLNQNTNAIPLANTLRDPNFVGTLFAPTDAALKPLEEAVGGDLPSLLGDEDEVNRVFSMAVIPGQALTLADLKNGMKLTTLDGSTVDVTVTPTAAGNVYQINKAYITKANIKAGRSIIHEMSSLVIPADYQEMLEALVPDDGSAAKPPVVVEAAAGGSGTTTTPTSPSPSPVGSTPSTTTTPTTSTPTTTTSKPSTTTTTTTSTPQQLQGSSAGSAVVGAALLAVPALLAMLL